MKEGDHGAFDPKVFATTVITSATGVAGYAG